MSMLRGGCLCGAVRYEASAPPTLVTLCHCALCRRSVGAQSVAWLTLPRTALRVEGASLTWYASSLRARRGFCPRCGTSLLFEATGEDTIDVTVGSLDDPSAHPPNCHIFVPDKVAWVGLEAGLPCHVEDVSSELL